MKKKFVNTTGITGKLIIFSAPSGSGKTTIVKYLLSEMSSLSFSISATTRVPRDNEKNGQDYYFLSVSEFKRKVDVGEFVEYEEVYEDVFYGTLQNEIERIWQMGKHVIFDVDVLGGLALKKKFSEKALAIFIQAPSIEVITERLISRGKDSPESLKKRIAKAKKEFEYAPQFEEVLLNDNLASACQKAVQIVENFIKN